MNAAQLAHLRRTMPPGTIVSWSLGDGIRQRGVVVGPPAPNGEMPVAWMTSNGTPDAGLISDVVPDSHGIWRLVRRFVCGAYVCSRESEAPASVTVTVHWLGESDAAREVA